MAQKQEYIDFQEVNPSPLHFEEVQKECIFDAKSGAKPAQRIEVKPLSVGGRMMIKLQDPKLWRRVARQVRPAGRALGIVVGVVAGVCAIGFILYRVAVFARNLLVALWAFVVESGLLLYAGIGVAVCVALYAAWYVHTSVRTSVPFEDWEPRTRTQTDTNSTVRQDGSDNVNVYVNVNKK